MRYLACLVVMSICSGRPSNKRDSRISCSEAQRDRRSILKCISRRYGFLCTTFLLQGAGGRHTSWEPTGRMGGTRLRAGSLWVKLGAASAAPSWMVGRVAPSLGGTRFRLGAHLGAVLCRAPALCVGPWSCAMSGPLVASRSA